MLTNFVKFQVLVFNYLWAKEPLSVWNLHGLIHIQFDIYLWENRRTIRYVQTFGCYLADFTLHESVR